MKPRIIGDRTVVLAEWTFIRGFPEKDARQLGRTLSNNAADRFCEGGMYEWCEEFTPGFNLNGHIYPDAGEVQLEFKNPDDLIAWKLRWW